MAEALVASSTCPRNFRCLASGPACARNSASSPRPTIKISTSGKLVAIFGSAPISTSMPLRGSS
ncbi:Uncharacterised protein [Mycobacteroides abscessus subsp. abscessus]|nr:Uncharacterised protein [Mycobacteroides abscessus subsp. abscessus]